jgi:hypothetical protein
MEIEELKYKHKETIRLSDLGILDEVDNHIDYDKTVDLVSGSLSKVSIEFAISVLESMDEHTQINDKIQELKTYLDEKS